MARINSFEELNCWKACRVVVKEVWKTTSKFPKDEKFDLKSNMNRAARSTRRNIAEGFGRHHHKENVQFCRISRGSLYELIDDLITSKEVNYITDEEYTELRMKVQEAIKLLNGYIRYLNSLVK